MSKKKKNPSKPKTSLGVTKLSGSSGGETNATYVPDGISTDKEDRELFFAEAFIGRFNAELPLGASVTIDDYVQNDTSDLDFDIECAEAQYLELAAIKPLTEEFGKESMSTGKIDIYTLGEWIYEGLIRHKSDRYGEVAAQTFLVIYPEDWQLIISSSVVSCVQAFCSERGSPFSGIFVVMASPDGPTIFYVIAPIAEAVPESESFRGKPLINMEPGKNKWTIDLS